jgi:hypothetical protein
MRLFLALTVGLLLAGCTLTPDYERPVLDVRRPWRKTRISVWPCNGFMRRAPS